ncbi:MAG: hypothetical protein JNL25_07615 [Rhodospirillaceae bacterium]|nr:hypothetical protein [Rhodospirillaceae bacterium]
MKQLLLDAEFATPTPIWSASAVDRYYGDPEIRFFRAVAATLRHAGLAGYYIVPHCLPDRSQMAGGNPAGNLGPFATRVKARSWSRRYLAKSGRGE